ncbi:TBC1 domain family member 15-like protein [Leptotrombidium deliense]|uniref:TBC1 domain family member 15-like protein n=1 Tax=Leptotrombidium deliense TaxID=299467 RepID=A0A443SQA0_9ACAR|nr:TBC1 domain family member 15-like protein [Leptotrombidium deliense]
MSSAHYSNRNDAEEEVDFFQLSDVGSLSRPSDHFNKYLPPPRDSRHFAARFFNDPVTTALNQFSKVANYANYVLSPSEEYENILQSIPPIDESRVDSLQSVESLPPLPIIPCSKSQCRLEPLMEEEFTSQFAKASKGDIVERVFCGGIVGSSLRRKLWPLLLGLTDNCDEFDWSDLESTFCHYETQWLNILPDQELRFTAFRERKSIAERDVVRSDRSHPFYADSTGNIDKLRRLLMAYIMYDFDTGYVQGMSDLATPILYIWDGDVVKSFWTFVQVMKLFKRNFEMSQEAISFQLKMLMKLIAATDPKFADYLKEKDSENCYFAFRWIICLFKREFMKGNNDDYDDCLKVWETIWSVHASIELEEKREKEEKVNGESDNPVSAEDYSRPSTPTKLTNIELYLMSICLAIIRQERNIILMSNFDACEILKHFNTLYLKDRLTDILQHASEIWYWLKHDGGEELLYKEKKETPVPTTEDDFVMLNDDVFSSTLHV